MRFIGKCLILPGIIPDHARVEEGTDSSEIFWGLLKMDRVLPAFLMQDLFLGAVGSSVGMTHGCSMYILSMGNT